MRLRALFTTAVVGAAVAATALAPHVAAAATRSAGAGWSCDYWQGGEMNFVPPGVGKTATWSTGYGQLNQPWDGGEVTVLETSPTTLTLVSVQLSPGWTDVINQAGPPKVVVQFTNTGGGGGVPANTLRLRSFFRIYLTRHTTNVYQVTENIAVCVPAT
jgi:hypothetical protein